MAMLLAQHGTQLNRYRCLKYGQVDDGLFHLHNSIGTQVIVADADMPTITQAERAMLREAITLGLFCIVKNPDNTYSWNPRLADYKTIRKDEVKHVARCRIYKRVPAWKQLNYLIEYVMLVEKKASNVTLTQGEQARIQTMRTKFASIVAVRDKSNTVDAQIDALTQEADVTALDVLNLPEWDT